MYMYISIFSKNINEIILYIVSLDLLFFISQLQHILKILPWPVPKWDGLIIFNSVNTSNVFIEVYLLNLSVCMSKSSCFGGFVILFFLTIASFNVNPILILELHLKTGMNIIVQGLFGLRKNGM